jgi:hypothetical protein
MTQDDTIDLRPESLPESQDDNLVDDGRQDVAVQPGAGSIFLNPIFGWCLVFLLIMLDVAIAILSWYSYKHNGLFTIRPTHGVRDNVVRLLWSSGPTFVTTIISGAILAPMALALYLVAPYTELERGKARAEESILANYVILSHFEQFLLAKRNRKWGLMSLTIATFLAALLDIAASGLIESRNVIVSIFH